MAGDAGTTRSRGTAAWNDHTDALLRDWHNRAAAAQHAHYLIAHRLRRRNLYLGVPAVVCSSIVGTSLFASLTRENVNTTLRIVIGCISVLAAVAAALQTFLRFAERASQHVTAGDWYAAIRRDTAQMLALPRSARGPAKPALDAIRTQMNRAGQNAPEIGDPLWVRIAADFHVSADDSAIMLP
ncbi:MAG TPA: SLATT domain-containing protein [Mycobacteriales bacterium]|nr:SLATT domain-containing protein [Mycobacteriales bacterium]